MEFEIEISPITPDFDAIDFSTIFDIGLPQDTSNITYSYSDGIIIVSVDYS